jgi:hypothetical protein
MKLSEAILLGSMLKPQHYGFGKEGTSCALEAAAEAINEEHWSLVYKTWPWVQTLSRCPIPQCDSLCYGWYNRSYRDIIYHLNDKHQLSREAIALWVTSVEPHEPESPSPTMHNVVAEGQEAQASRR